MPEDRPARNTTFHHDRDIMRQTSKVGFEVPDYLFLEIPDREDAEAWISEQLAGMKELFMRVWDDRWKRR